MRILLVSPSSAQDLTQQTLRQLPFFQKDAFFAPHACALVAALTPPDHEVQIHDEDLHGPVDSVLEVTDFDVVGLSLLGNDLVRAREIAERYRRGPRSGLLVAGGPSMLHMLPRLRPLLDVAFVGEAEATWPRFLDELAADGRPSRSLYRQVARPEMAAVPIPRWELLGRDLQRYSLASVQTLRGCPRDCAFCDVIYTYGRAIRRKPIDQVLGEVALLESLGVELIFFADDNFAADRRHTKALLRRLVALNRSFETHLSFATQLDITIADDDELLQLLLDAGFVEVQIGVESPDQSSLRDLHKHQNLQRDLVASVRKIQSYGIVVLAHMILGMDSDDHQAFGRAERFLSQADVVHQASHPLMAPPGTRLWYELKRQGRLVEVTAEMHDRLDLDTNVVPKQMTRLELIEGLVRYRLSVSEPDRFLERARQFLAGITERPSEPRDNSPSPRDKWRMLVGMLRHFLIEVPTPERRLFITLVSEVARQRPELIPTAIYLLACHRMERCQAEISARWAAAIESAEEALPGGRPVLSTATLITPALRSQFRELARAAYGQVRGRASSRPVVYEAVVDALVEYVERYGETFEELDEGQRSALTTCCARALAQLEATGGDERDDGLPTEGPPPGFTREILDALDQTLRFDLRVWSEKDVTSGPAQG